MVADLAASVQPVWCPVRRRPLGHSGSNIRARRTPGSGDVVTTSGTSTPWWLWPASPRANAALVGHYALLDCDVFFDAVSVAVPPLSPPDCALPAAV